MLLFGVGHDTVHAGINAHSRSFDLSIAQYSPRGVWSDGTTIWVANNLGRNSKLWAYRQATGARTHDKDISLTDGNNKPMGIWSDGSIMWVVDWDDNKLYAYELDTGARKSDRDISLNRYNTTPRGGWRHAPARFTWSTRTTSTFTHTSCPTDLGSWLRNSTFTAPMTVPGA